MLCLFLMLDNLYTFCSLCGLHDIHGIMKFERIVEYYTNHINQQEKIQRKEVTIVMIIVQKIQKALRKYSFKKYFF